MLKVLLLAFAILITGIINGITGLVEELSAFLEPPHTVLQKQAPQDQSTLQKNNLNHKNIKTNLKSLPKNQTAVAEQVNKVRVVAGDNGVSRKTVQSSLSIITDLSLPILNQNFNLTLSQNADVVLFSSKTSYASALQKAGVDSKLVPALVANSGGVTIGTDIWIPIYALQNKADLANVLTHELTHVVFNQMRIGDGLPTWINEGTAWYNGLTAQTKVNAAATKLDMAALQNEVLTAAKSGKLYPLSASEQDIINAPYNIEYQDYLAVNYLIQHYGKSAFQSFLKQCETNNAEASFQNQYHIGLKAYENAVNQSLQRGE